MNLLSALLKAREPVSWDHIQAIEGYNDEAATRTRQRRFERDIKALEETGLRVKRTVVFNQPQYEIDRGSCLLPALNLSLEQRLLMYRIGMAYLEGEGAGPLRKHLSGALLKLQAGAGREGLPAELPGTFIKRTLNRRPGEAERLTVIGEALLDRRRVMFDYEPRGRKPGGRTVAPWALVSRRGGWYLVGYDIKRKGERTFRLSRVRGAVKLATPEQKPPEYDVPTDFDPERSFAADVFGHGESAFKDVQIKFDAEVAFVVENEFEGIYEIRKYKNGSILLKLPGAHPGDLLRYLGEFPGHWEVRAPVELREHVIERLRESLKSAEGATP